MNIQNTKTTQDDDREKIQFQLFGLIQTNHNRIARDARTITNEPIETKTTTKTNGAVSTGRDVGLHTLKKWRNTHWLISKGRYHGNDFHIDENYYMHPTDLEPWFSKLEKSLLINEDFIMQISNLLSGSVSQPQIELIQKLMRKGAYMNDPNIPWKSVVKKYGTPIREDHPQKLIELTSQRSLLIPPDQRKVEEANCIWNFVKFKSHTK